MVIKTVATNRKAYHNYHIGESVEAGIALTGTEIKSIRNGRISLGDAYVSPEAGELWLVNAHIARYDAGSYMSHEPKRRRKLLLHRKQIESLTSYIAEKGLTLDIGAFVTGLEYATGTTATVIGKPSEDFFRLAVEDMGISPDRAAMVGDDIISDVGGAQFAGMAGILVRTGKYRPEIANRSEIKPDLTIDSVAALKSLL